MSARHGIAAALFAAWAACAGAQEWRPQKNVDLVVASAAGGAADRQSRVMQKFLQAMPEFPSVTVTNRPGGGGLVALNHIVQQRGDPHILGTLSTAVVTNQIVGVSTVRYQDITPLNILLREYILVTTRAESPIASASDLVARLRKSPASVTFGFSTALGNQNHVLLGMIAKAAGIDPKLLKIVIYPSGGPGVTAMLGGHVDFHVGTPGTALPHVQAGRARAIGISSPQRQPGRLAALPTFREQGVDAVYYSWRGFLAPGGLTAAQIAFWDQVFARVILADDWKKNLDENAWEQDFRPSAETRRHLDAEHELLRRMLAELGVVGTK